MLYQGDDIGTLGGPDPDNRKMQRFTGLSADERAPDEPREGRHRYARNTRRSAAASGRTSSSRTGSGCTSSRHESDEVYVAINRDDNKQWSPPPGFVDGLGNCSNGVVPILTSCIFVKP